MKLAHDSVQWHILGISYVEPTGFATTGLLVAKSLNNG
jgi:hypothetical protein